MDLTSTPSMRLHEPTKSPSHKSIRDGAYVLSPDVTLRPVAASPAVARECEGPGDNSDKKAQDIVAEAEPRDNFLTTSGPSQTVPCEEDGHLVSDSAASHHLSEAKRPAPLDEQLVDPPIRSRSRSMIDLREMKRQPEPEAVQLQRHRDHLQQVAPLLRAKSTALLWGNVAVKLAHEPSSMSMFGPRVTTVSGAVASDHKSLRGPPAAHSSGKRALGYRAVTRVNSQLQDSDVVGGMHHSSSDPAIQGSGEKYHHFLSAPTAPNGEWSISPQNIDSLQHHTGDVRSGVFQGGGSTPLVEATPHSPSSVTPVQGTPALREPATNRDSARKKSDPASPPQMDDEDRMEAVIRRGNNAYAVHVIPWDQRTFFNNEFGQSTCAYCVSPKFWMRLDWTIRAALFALLPATILSLDPSTTERFSLPGVVSNFAFWISSPTLGSGLRELYVTLKGGSLTLAVLVLVTVIKPQQNWAFILVFFFSIFFVSTFAEQVKKMAAWSISVYMLQYFSDSTTGMNFVENYFISMLIGFAFGAVSFVLPRIVWSSRQASKHIANLGHIASISIQGICASFLCCSAFERDLNLIKLRQLKLACQSDLKLLDIALEEASYEPHSGLVLARMKARRDLLETLVNIIMSALQVVEVVADSPVVIQTPLCNAFGPAIQHDVSYLAAAMDQALLKICSSDKELTPADILSFRAARASFQSRLAEVRQELILNNENYRTDVSDVFLGFFMFNIDEMAQAIAGFVDPTDAPSHVLEWLTFPRDDVVSFVGTLRYVTREIAAGRVPRRVKEAFKLALAMTLAAMLQVFRLSGTAVIAGPSIIAWVYQTTGAESFQYAVNRLLGTVVGSLTALVAVQTSGSDLWRLYLWIALLALVGCFVQTSPTYTQAGNAMVFSVLSIAAPSTTSASAVDRIQQNVFAILIYFAIAYLIWPVRATDKIKLHLDTGLRSFRDAITKILSELDRPADSTSITIEVTSRLAEWKKAITKQEGLIGPAVKEPTMISSNFPEQTWLQIITSQQNIFSLLHMMRYAYYTFQSSLSTGRSVHWLLLQSLAPAAKDLADLIFAAIDVYLLGLAKVTVVPTHHLVRLKISLMEGQEALIQKYITTLLHRMTDNVDDEQERRLASSGSGPEDNGQGPTEVVQPFGGATVASAPERQNLSFVEFERTFKQQQQNTPARSTISATKHTVPTSSGNPIELRRRHMVAAERSSSCHRSPPTVSRIGSPTVVSTFPLELPPTTSFPTDDHPSGIPSDVCSEVLSFVLSNEDIHSLEAFLFAVRATVFELSQLQKSLIALYHAEEIANRQF